MEEEIHALQAMFCLPGEVEVQGNASLFVVHLVRKMQKV